MQATAEQHREKRCFKCSEVKPLDEFYAHPRMMDGRLNKCKTCTKRDVSDHRMKHIERFREYDRRRFQEDPERRADTLRRSKEYFAAHPEKMRERALAYQSNYPAARAAHVLVGHAIRSGKLTKQPCEVCGTAEVHGHHDDYAEPLKVRWLCTEHHFEWHRLNGPGKNRD